MIEKSAFLEKYRIEKDAFEQLNLTWDDLLAIAEDHSANSASLKVAADMISSSLSGIQAVHSVRSRIKDPEHLMEKILRKRKDDPARLVTLENYRTEITDLLGVRALHLFKGEWLQIHDAILKTWEFAPGHQPIAFIRSGDEAGGFEAAGCEVKVHPRGYRSVHYIIGCRPTKELTRAELQVRTLFEEGWSEVDHRIVYPYHIDDELLAGYLSIFNHMAGGADQMATYIRHLKDQLTDLRATASQNDSKTARAISDLEAVQRQLAATKGDIEKERSESRRLQSIIDSLKQSVPVTDLTLGNLGKIFSSTTSSSGVPSSFTSTATPSSLFLSNVIAPRVCRNCGAILPSGVGILSTVRCGQCGLEQ